MKKVIYSLFCAFAINACTNVFASRVIYGFEAAQVVTGAQQVVTSDHSSIPDMVIFEEAKQPLFGDPELWIRLTFGLGSDYGLKTLAVDPDQIGFTHYRYQQTLNGHPIDGTMWLIHVKNGKVVSMNGLLFNNIKQAGAPSISEADALSKALAYVNAASYKWQNPEEENALRQIMNDPSATYFPKGELMFARDSKKQDFNYHLAYRFDIYAHEPMSRQYIFVDATSGAIADFQDRIWEVNRTGTAVTAYAGTQSIVADSTSNSYRLREAPRGAGLGIETYNLQRTTTYTNTDFTDTDNYWNNVNANKDQYATDCHLAAEKTYDYYYNTYGRNSINNAGLKLISYVHYSTNYVNAFWNGSYMTYGDGNATYSPLTSLDIGGHEITHGLTSYTANLTYSYESGALNESFSDCFGTTIEWYADPVHGDWLIGEDIGAAFRSHSNPNAYGDPDTYLGTNWYTGTGDNGGVHTNSGVQNYWFYLLANGGSGTNDIGNAFNVTGISLTKAAAIAFRSLTVYLTSSSNYANARTYSIQAATDLYGPCSPEVIATANAWYAVGVGAQGSGGPSTVTAAGLTTICDGSTVALSASPIAGSTYQWNRNGSAISGATLISYNASLAGTYTVTTTGCGASTYTSNSIVVSVISVTSSINPAGTASGCNNVLLTSGGTTGYGYQWNNNGVPISGATNSTYSATASGNYTLTLQAATYPNQNFSSAGSTSIPDNTCTNPAINTINVSGYVGAVNSSGITCTVNITHTYDGDINFMLEAPNGDVIGLSDFAGGAGDNFTNTVFSDAGANTVANGAAPFTGTYKPWQALITSCTNSNKIGFGAIGGGTINPNGAWRLRVYDRYAQDLGTINSWSISFPSYTVPNPNCGPVTSPATTVTIGGGISVSAGTYSPVCQNSALVNLSGSPAGGTFTGSGVNGNSFNPSIGPGSYPVTYSYTDANGCSGQNTTNIVVNALPVVTAAPASGCSGSAITLPGSPAGGSWSVANPYSGPSTSYTYTFTDGNGCTNTSSPQNITVNPLPTVNAGTYTSVCAGGNLVTLAGSPAGGTFSGTGVSGNTFDPIVGVGNYSITYSYTDANGCSNTNTSSITVNGIPNVSAGTYPQVCSNAGLVALNGVPSGGTWSGSGVTGNNFDPSIGAGTYGLTYSYTDANGCSNSATAFQKVNGLPTVNAGTYPSACDKSSNIALTGSPAGGTWSGTGISGTTFVTASVIPGSYNVTYTYTDALGCSNSSTTTIVVNSLPTVTASNVSGCTGSSIALTGSPAGGSWSLSNPYTGPSTTYTYTYTDGNGCTNTSGNASITVNPLPTVSFSGLSGTYSVNSSSSTLVGAPSGGTFSGPGVIGNSFSPSLAGVGGPYSITYNYTDGNGCSNSSTLQTTVTSCSAPAQPGTITATGGNTKVCPGDSKIYSISAVAGATSYTWTAPTGASIISGQGTTSVTVSYTAAFTASGTLSVIANSGCGNSLARTLTITRNNPSTPSVISGAASAVCAGTNGNYSVTNVAGMIYNWTAPVNASIVSGQGTNAVSVSFSGSFTSGSLTVTASNGCGTSPVRSLSILSKPAMPGTISGLSNTVCASTTGTYSVTNVAGVTYNWTAPANATIQSGQGTNSVVISFSGTFTSGILSVAGTNACGSSSLRTLSIASVPARPGSITGLLNNLCNAGGVPYSISAVANATGYNWTIPAAASFVTNTGTAISLNYGALVSGQICVTSANSCGNSASRCATVTGKPATPSAITGPASVCANQASVSYSCATQSGATYTWLVPAGATIASGQGTGNITVNWGTVGGTVRVTPSNACGTATARTLSVAITCREAASILDESSFVIIPNPATEYAICDYNSTVKGMITMAVTDLTGRVLVQNVIDVEPGSNKIDMHISTFAKGVYLVSVLNEQNILSVKKLVVE